MREPADPWQAVTWQAAGPCQESWTSAAASATSTLRLEVDFPRWLMDGQARGVTGWRDAGLWANMSASGAWREQEGGRGRCRRIGPRVSGLTYCHRECRRGAGVGVLAFLQ